MKVIVTFSVLIAKQSIEGCLNTGRKEIFKEKRFLKLGTLRTTLCFNDQVKLNYTQIIMFYELVRWRLRAVHSFRRSPSREFNIKQTNKQKKPSENCRQCAALNSGSEANCGAPLS